MNSRTTHADAQARIKASRKGKFKPTIPKGSAMAVTGTAAQVEKQAKIPEGRTVTGKVEKFTNTPFAARGKK